MPDDTYKTSSDILKTCASNNNLNVEKIEKLIKIEKNYQLRNRRAGIYDSLREIVEYEN